MLLIERFADKVPAALVVLIGGVIAGTIFDLADEGVEVLGEVPSGLAAPALPDIAASDIGALIMGGLAIALVAFAEEVGPANEFASKHRYETDGNQELVGLGAANLGAGLFQGFPVGSSLSTSAANDGAGARSPLSLLVAAFVVVVVALFLTGTLENLPEPTLAAIVLVAISGLMKTPQMKRLWKISRRDFLLAATALAGVLIFDTLAGLTIAVIVSLGLVIWRASSASLAPLGRKPGSGEFVALSKNPESLTVDGLLIVRPEEPMFFANAASIRAAVRRAAEASETPLVAVVLDLEATVDIDVPGCDSLRELAEDLDRQNIQLGLTRVRSTMRQILDDTGVTTLSGQTGSSPQMEQRSWCLHPEPGRLQTPTPSQQRRVRPSASSPISSMTRRCPCVFVVRSRRLNPTQSRGPTTTFRPALASWPRSFDHHSRTASGR